MTPCKTHIQFIICIVALLLLSSCNKKVDWVVDYDSSIKIPYGTYIVRNELPILFPNSEIINVNQVAYSQLNELQYDYSNIFMYINSSSNDDLYFWENAEVFVNADNNILFGAFETFSDPWSRVQTMSLNINPPSSNTIYKSEMQYPLEYTLKMHTNINNTKTYKIKGVLQGNYFATYPTNAEVLGEIYINGKKYPNYIRYPQGMGWYYLHAEPNIFTNYAMLNSNAPSYVEDVFSFLPNYKIYWNNNKIKYRRSVSERGSYEGGAFDFMNFAWNQKPLKYGLICFLLAGLFYVLFNSSRRQKAVAYVPPYGNDLLDYSKSLEKIYRKSENFKYLCTQKITHFNHEIREHFYLTQIEYTEKFAQQLSNKSQVPIGECINLINYIHEINQMGYCSYEQFLSLSDNLNQFYLRSKIYGKQ